jgi:hypothetical protein
MPTTTAVVLFGAFLIAHGLVHISLTWVPVPAPGAARTPFFPAWWRETIDPAWPAARLGLPPRGVRLLGSALWVLLLAGYVLAGVLLIFFPAQTALWQGLTCAASLLSLAFLALYWHPWLLVGVLIDVGLLAAVWLRWPPVLFVN